MDYEKAHDYISELDGRAPGSELMALSSLEELGFSIPAILIKRFKNSRRWADRALCVSHCIEYAKSNEHAFQLGIMALRDRSKTVQRMACKLLSVAQRREAIAPLEKLLSEDKLKRDAQAAIDALARPGKR